LHADENRDGGFSTAFGPKNAPRVTPDLGARRSTAHGGRALGYDIAMNPSRRNVLHALVGALSPSFLAGASRAAPAVAPMLTVEALAGLERQSGGRFGVAIIAGNGSERGQHRGDERFPMCSTFKLLAVAAVLARVDRGQEQLDRALAFGASDLLEYAPVARAHAAEGQLTVSQTCEAAITLSDNTAANLLLASLGGPARVTDFVRRVGDNTTRLDRDEPSLSECLPGDERDTTSPRAMARTLRALLIGPTLSKASRDRLALWMTACTTGLQRLRAGLPPTWRAGDKTGSGYGGTTNDIAILWPPDGKPILIAAYLTQTSASAEVRNGVFAELARRIAELKAAQA
jgi:beta-lactamase class A